MAQDSDSRLSSLVLTSLPSTTAASSATIQQPLACHEGTRRRNEMACSGILLHLAGGYPPLELNAGDRLSRLVWAAHTEGRI